MTLAILALGSNLGDRLGNLRAATGLLEERGCTVTRCSSVWETAPVPPDQPPFLNAVVAIETGLDPRALLGVAKEVEQLLGRRPSRRWGPRPADIDILFYGNERINEPDLVIPHPEAARRGFVLAALAEVWRGPLPVLGVSAAELLSRVENTGRKRTPASLRPS